MNKTDIAWSAGIIEGEGSITLRASGRPNVTIEMTDLDVLEKLQEIWGGHIYKNKMREPHWKQTWSWALVRSADTEKCLTLILPYLYQRKAGKAREALKSLSICEMIAWAKQQRVKRMRVAVKKLHKDGLTHQKIADSVGYSRSYISHIISGRYD